MAFAGYQQDPRVPNALQLSANLSTGKNIYEGPVPQGANETLYRYTGITQEGPLSTNSTTPPSSGGGGGGGGGGATDGNDFDGLTPVATLDAIYKPITDFLSKAESTIRGQQSGIEGDIRSLESEQLAAAAAQGALTGRTIDTQQRQGEQRAEDAITGARRLFSELSRGGRQRFGGSSSAGEAYQTLGATEFQRNRGNIAQQAAEFGQQIANARISLRERTEQAVNAIKNQTARQMNEARRAFQDRLLEISRLRAESESAKAERRLQALQDLRNQVFQIRLADAQEKGQVQQLATQLETQISGLEQQNTGATQQLGQSYQAGLGQTNLNPDTTLALGLPGQGGSQPYTGQVSTREEELLNPTGALRPRDELSTVFG